MGLSRGERVCAFIERFCRIPSGDKIGKPFLLEDFERRFVLDVYDNPYGTTEAILSVARKNGKTPLIAGIVLANVVGPEAFPNSQVVSGALSRDQASIVFDYAVKMIRQSQMLQALTRIVPSGKRIYGIAKNVEYRALSSESSTAHGFAPRVAILDELGQIKGPTDDFVSAVTSAQGAYSDSLLIVISTQAPTDADLLSLRIDSQLNAPDPRRVLHLYSAPKDCALDDRAAWIAANPALGIFKSLSSVEDASRRAIELPSSEAEFRNFHLNQRVEALNPFVSRKVWESNGAGPDPIEGQDVYGGLDLSEVHDLTSLVLTSTQGDVYPTFWLPKEGLAEKSKKDRVPYDVWAREGLLLTTPGSAIEYEFIAEHLRGVFDRCHVVKLGFDRYHMKFLKPWLMKANFTDDELLRFVEFGQGTQSMTPALRELEVRLLNGQLKHGMHPVLTMCAANAKVVGDSGARKFDKRKARGRIDGMVALAMSVGVMPPVEEERQFQSFML